jgi:hypothetical protein
MRSRVVKRDDFYRTYPFRTWSRV